MSAAQEEFQELMRDKERRTAHPEDAEHDTRSFLNLSDDDAAHDSSSDDDARPTSPTAADSSDEDLPRPSLSQARPTIPRTRYAANTGPKGVISDAQDFRDSRRLHRHSIRGLDGLPAAYARGGVPVLGPAPAEKFRGSSDEEEEEGEEKEGEEDGDDDFMTLWRRTRLEQLRGGAYESKMHARAREKRRWGGLVTVDGEGYLDAVDRSPPDTVVVVYIYDDTSEASTSIEDCLRALARTHAGTRFVRLHFLEAEMEPAGVPALLAYRGGDKFAGLVPVMDEMPDDAPLGPDTLEAVLKRYQILR